MDILYCLILLYLYIAGVFLVKEIEDNIFICLTWPLCFIIAPVVRFVKRTRKRFKKG